MSKAKQACLAAGAGFATPATREKEPSLISWLVLVACVMGRYKNTLLFLQ